MQFRSPSTPKVKPSRPAGTGAFAVTEKMWEKALKFVKRHGPTKRGVFQKAIKECLVEGVSVNTLKTRFKESNTAKSSTGVSQWLDKDIEDKLVTYVKEAQACNFCVTKTKLTEIVAAYGKALNLPVVGGPKWMKNFFARHKELSVRQGQLLEASRMVSAEAIKRYADIAELVCKGVAPEDTWCMDETALTGQIPRQKVVAEKGKHAYMPDFKSNMGHLTMLVAISATSRVAATTLIWQRPEGVDVPPDGAAGQCDITAAPPPTHTHTHTHNSRSL